MCFKFLAREAENEIWVMFN